MGLLAAPVAVAHIGADDGHEMPISCDNSKFQQDQGMLAEQYSHRNVPYGQHLELPEHVCGSVVKVYRSRKSRSGWHGYFLMTVGQGQTLRIVSNLDNMNAPQWPWVAEGDMIDVRGRYYFDGPHRQGLDWTHHGTSRKWPWGGYVTVNGKRYE
ncbi:DUF3465 domain-containing protein [Acetobacteraceae bacterium ESL0709]|nr:DUF3465 domain-containing protein [Acetobacteraceae bacterium ESL0697]MDF7677273.1 DUF3465 domain-containing protein [Acetobacteraceae bacterium ESL0709]